MNPLSVDMGVWEEAVAKAIPQCASPQQAIAWADAIVAAHAARSIDVVTSVTNTIEFPFSDEEIIAEIRRRRARGEAPTLATGLLDSTAIAPGPESSGCDITDPSSLLVDVAQTPERRARRSTPQTLEGPELPTPPPSLEAGETLQKTSVSYVVRRRRA